MHYSVLGRPQMRKSLDQSVGDLWLSVLLPPFTIIIASAISTMRWIYTPSAVFVEGTRVPVSELARFEIALFDLVSSCWDVWGGWNQSFHTALRSEMKELLLAYAIQPHTILSYPPRFQVWMRQTWCLASQNPKGQAKVDLMISSTKASDISLSLDGKIMFFWYCFSLILTLI